MATSRFREVPVNCWPSDVKIRSRLNYALADQETRGSSDFPLLLKQNGAIGDSSIASIVCVTSEDVLTFGDVETSYKSISADFLKELCTKHSIKWEARDVHLEELKSSREVMLVSTPFCVLPVRSVDETPFADKFEMASRLYRFWLDSIR